VSVSCLRFVTFANFDQGSGFFSESSMPCLYTYPTQGTSRAWQP
jgi:hypothetical protein